MSKFTIKVELQSLKIEVEGSREDVPRLAERVGEQFGNLLKPALLLEVGNGNKAGAGLEGSGKEKTRGSRRKAGAGVNKTPADEINLSIDPSKHGSPTQA